MAQSPSSWQNANVAQKFLDERRAAIPYGSDQVDVMLRLIERFQPEAESVVDLGCGDGFLARAILERYPETTAVLVDQSEPMLDRAVQAMAAYAGRYGIVQADLANPLSASGVNGPADLVVSGFAIHHLPHERKRELYSEIFEMLASGGLFINIEHVASATPELEEIYDSAYIDAIADRTGKDRAIVHSEYHNRPDKADNILEHVETQLAWLRAIGYQQVDCYFKWFELTVFGGLKG